MPKAIVFQPQSSNPVPGSEDSLWVNSSNQLIYTPISGSPINISTGASGANSIAQMQNNTGMTIAAFTPVSVNSSGYLQLIDVTNVSNAITFVGITVSSIANGSAGPIIISGVLSNITTSIAFGASVWVDTTGNLTSTIPAIGVNGFVEGDAVLKVGVITQDPFSSGQKNIVINCQYVATL